MELKRRMTFEEMEQHMVENTTKIPSKTAVGRYAKSLGYTTYPDGQQKGRVFLCE